MAPIAAVTLVPFPAPEAPEVSVVMVTHGGWQHTASALAALAANTPAVYELIVVDNASNDETPARLRELEGVTVVINERNVGFGVACNQGAARARGRHLVLLNNDASVHPRWLDALLRVVDEEPDVAAVAARLLHPNGTLQEAGCILWRDARVLSYGDGDDPTLPDYNFRRDVDYASAACMLIRRSAFEETGGFDPVFAPAYCEDVDLCLLLRVLGHRVVYQPRATATHVRGAASKSREVRRLLARNRPILRERWRAVLSMLPPESYHRDPMALAGGRDAVCCERVLVLCAEVPGDGDPLRAAVLAARRERPGLRVTVLASARGQGAAASLQDAGVEVATALQDTEGWLRRRALHYGIVVDAGAESVVAQAARRSQPQAAWLEARGLDERGLEGLAAAAGAVAPGLRER